MRGLEGKRVVVTGGTSGIGEATSRRFLEEGARVVALAVGEEEVSTAQERLPGLAAALRCDVADETAVAAAFAGADELLGGVDVLVANAGISVRKPFLEIEEADWRRVLDVNLTGVFHCAQQAARRMVGGDGGAILMTASTNGLTGHEFYADYNASKAGVILLARTMALELAPTVRVDSARPSREAGGARRPLCLPRERRGRLLHGRGDLDGRGRDGLTCPYLLT